MAVVVALVIISYSCVRFYVNRIGGIYCFKRVILGIVLGATSVMGGIDTNAAVGIVLLVIS